MFGIRVTGNQNVPKYDFWLVANKSVVYSVFFSQFFEAVPKGDGLKKYGPSNIALPSLEWEWSDIVGEGDNLTFTITAKNGGHGNGKQFTALTFTNHIRANATLNPDNTTLNAPLLKFDIEIEDYTWVSTEKDAKIVLLFDFHTAGEKPEKNGDRVSLGEAYFSAASTASVWSDDPEKATDINVSTEFSGSGSESGIWLVYDHFTAPHLLHDPELGVGSPSDDGPNVLAIVLPIVFVVALIAIGVGFFVYRQRLKYQSI